MDQNPTQKLIERYFENDLSSDELAAFQKRLSNDPDFAKAFQLERELMEGIEAFGNEQLRKQLEMIHSEETGEVETTDEEEDEPPSFVSPFDPELVGGKMVKMVGRKWWLAAAVLILGLVARVLFWESNPTPQQLYAIYAVHEFNFTEMGTSEELLSNAEGLLKAEKYEESLPVLDTYLEANQNDKEVMKAKGIALLETGKYEEALDIFREVGQASPIFENEANWYIALTYLKQGKIKNCKKALSAISATSPKHKDANKLLEYLK